MQTRSKRLDFRFFAGSAAILFSLKAAATSSAVLEFVRVSAPSDAVRLLSTLETAEPGRLSRLNSALVDFCEAPQTRSGSASAESQYRKSRTCEFIPLYRSYEAVQRKLALLVSDKSLNINSAIPSELSLRSLGWSFDAFANSIGEESKAQTVVDWIVQRRALAQTLGFAIEEFSERNHSPGQTATTVVLPALRASLTSPLAIGQIAAFVNAKKCEPNQRACVTQSAWLRAWLAARAAPVRESLVRLSAYFRDASRDGQGSDIDVLAELFRRDDDVSESRSADPVRHADSASKSYLKFIDRATMRSLGAPAALSDGAFAKAQAGAIVAVETLRAFGGEPPPKLAAQEAACLADDACPAYRAEPGAQALERKIAEEIKTPIRDFESYVYQTERGL